MFISERPEGFETNSSAYCGVVWSGAANDYGFVVPDQ
jgi:hypothetical protein